MFESGSINNLNSKNWTHGETGRRRMYFFYVNAVLLETAGSSGGTIC